MNSPGHDIALLIAAASIGTFGSESAWGVFVGREPAKPDSCITVYDTSGGEPDTDELDWFRPTFQVRVRGVSYQDAYDKQIAIRDALIYASPVDVTGGRFVGIMMTSDVMSIGGEDSKRHILTANYRAIREES